MALSLAGCLSSASDVSSDVTFETVERGSSGIVAAQSVVVRDNASWLALWAQHTSNRYPPSPAPVVDFSKNMVLAVFLGPRPNSCYSMAITRVFWNYSGLVVGYHENTPTPYATCTPAFVEPTHMVSVPASDAPVEFVKE